jgi:hypothetical protein
VGDLNAAQDVVDADAADDGLCRTPKHLRSEDLAEVEILLGQGRNHLDRHDLATLAHLLNDPVDTQLGDRRKDALSHPNCDLNGPTDGP